MGMTCTQYTYECQGKDGKPGCSWKNPLEPMLEPFLKSIPCPRCGGVARAIAREVPCPMIPLPRCATIANEA